MGPASRKWMRRRSGNILRCLPGPGRTWICRGGCWVGGHTKVMRTQQLHKTSIVMGCGSCEGEFSSSFSILLVAPNANRFQIHPGSACDPEHPEELKVSTNGTFPKCFHKSRVLGNWMIQVIRVVLHSVTSSCLQCVRQHRGRILENPSLNLIP